MAQIIHIHPDNPQPRLIQQVVEVLQKEGAVIAYPTDSAYALGCRLGDKEAMEKIRYIRKLDEKHHFTLVCRDLSEIAIYARISNSVFRLLKAYTPGAYTFILEATHEVPRRLQHPKRKTIGLRIPDNRIALALLNDLNEPLMSVTLQLPGEAMPLSEAEEIDRHLHGQINLIVDGGPCGLEPTTVVDLVESPKLIRAGRGDPKPFE